MIVNFYWDRDADLLVYAVSGDAFPRSQLLVQFADADNPDNVWTASVLAPVSPAARYRLGALPVAKLAAPRCLLTAQVWPRTEGNESKLRTKFEFTLQNARPVSARIAANWRIKTGGGRPILIVIKAAEEENALSDEKGPGFADFAGRFTIQSNITSPDMLIDKQSNRSVILPNEEGNVEVCPSFGHRAAIYPSTRAEGDAPSRRIALDLNDSGASNGSIRLTLLDDQADLHLVIMALSLGKLSDRLSSVSLLRDCRDLAKVTLHAGASMDLAAGHYNLAPLERLVIHAADDAIPELVEPEKANFLKRFLGIEAQQPAPVRPLPPTSVVFVNRAAQDRFEDIGPVLALANYVTSFEIDKMLSRALRADMLAQQGRLPYGSPRARIWSLPTCACFEMSALTVGTGKPNPIEFMLHADRAFDPAYPDHQSNSLDDRTALARLMDKLFGSNKNSSDYAEEDAAWLWQASNAGVPADHIRSILLDEDLRDWVAEFVPMPDPASPDRFGAALRLLARLVADRDEPLEFGRFFGLLSVPKPRSTTDELINWFERLSYDEVEKAVPDAAIVQNIGRGLVDALKPLVLGFAFSDRQDDMTFCLELLRKARTKLNQQNDLGPHDPVFWAKDAATGILKQLDSLLAELGEKFDNPANPKASQLAWNNLWKVTQKWVDPARLAYDDGVHPADLARALRHLFTAKAAHPFWSKSSIAGIKVLLS